MQVFDASSTIHAWDNYPIAQFPRMWEWLAGEVQSGRILFPGVAFIEIANKIPECGAWLEVQGVTKLQVTNAIVQVALGIKGQLGIVNDQYGAGVGENDIFIVATAKAYNHRLVSDESVQNILPATLKKYKIPAVCGLQDVGVPCINFITFLKQSGGVFG